MATYRLRTVHGIPLCALLLVTAAQAQTPRDDYRRQLDQLRRETLLQVSSDIPADQRVFADYGAYYTFNYLTVDDNLGNNHVLREHDVVAYGRVVYDGAQELFLRFSGGYQDFNEGDSFDGRGDAPIDGDLDIGYYRFDLARYLGAYKGQEIDGNVSFKIGRDIIYWGNGLALAQRIDGLQLELSTGPLEIQAIAGITPVRTVDFEASRPDFDFNTRRGYYGVMASAQVGEHKPFIYALMQSDYNKDEVFKQGNVTTHFGYDSFYIGMGSSGNFGDRIIYGAELVYEFGHDLSNSFTTSGPLLTPVEQTTDDICAYAADFRLDYLVPDIHKTRVSAELVLSSGDNDRLNSTNTFEGNKPNTTDNAYNAFSLVNTGQSFAPSVSNLLMVRGGVSSYPFPDVGWLRRLQIGVDVFAYSRMSSSAPIDEPLLPDQNNRFLGWEPDLYLNWPITSDITLALRYGVFFPDKDAFPDDDLRQFFSTSVTFAF